MIMKMDTIYLIMSFMASHFIRILSNHNEIQVMYQEYKDFAGKYLPPFHEIFMPPTSKKLRGHIGLGLSVQCSE